MFSGVVHDARERRLALRDVIKPNHTRPARNEFAPARILHDRGSTGREITRSATAEPAAVRRDVTVLGDRPFAGAVGNEPHVIVSPLRLGPAFDELPAIT